MRQITKDIEITIDGSPQGFRLTKLDAFSGVMLLRLLMRLEERAELGDGSSTDHECGVRKNRPLRSAPTLLDLISSLSEDDLLDITELIRVRRENENRAADAARA